MESLQIYKPNNSALYRLNRLFSGLSKKQKNGISSFNIYRKRTSMIKKYRLWMKNEKYNESFIKSYNMYIEALNDYMMNKVYKRVKIETATEYEKNILSKYYYILKLKDEHYAEYNLKKQKYLINIDYENIQDDEKTFEQYKDVYEHIINQLYKDIMKLSKNKDDTLKQEVLLNVLEEYNNDKFVRYILLKNNIEPYESKKDIGENEIEKYNIKKYETLLEIAEKIFESVVKEDCINYIRNKIKEEEEALKKKQQRTIKLCNKEIKNVKYIKIKKYKREIKTYNKEIKNVKYIKIKKQKRVIKLYNKEIKNTKYIKIKEATQNGKRGEQK